MSNDRQIANELDKLAALQSARVAVSAEMQEEIDEIITPEMNERLIAIDEKYASAYETVDKAIREQTELVKQLVADAGKSVKGKSLMAVYSRGRVMWNTEALDGYMVAHPEIAAMRRIGAPVISIKKM